MSNDTARKVVVAAALLGVAVVVYQGRSGTTAVQTYKRVWGLLLLVAGGSVLADFAPSVVGPYMALVLIGFLLSNKAGLGGIFSSAAKGVSSGTSTAGG